MSRWDNPLFIGICECCGLIYHRRAPNQRWCNRFKICKEDRKAVALEQRRKSIKQRREDKYYEQDIKNIHNSLWTFHHMGECWGCYEHKQLNRPGLCRQCYSYINKQENVGGDFLYA